MLRLPRSTHVVLLATCTLAVAAVLSGDGLARASYMADPDHSSHTARKVRITFDRDDLPPAPFVRLDLNEPPRVDALPSPVSLGEGQVPQRPVRLDLGETTEPVAVLAQTPRRVVRLSLDDGPPPDLAPRVFHADLDDAETFTASAPTGGTGPVRLVRSDL